MAIELVRCRVLRPIEIGGRIATQNEIVWLRADDADRLVEAGYIEVRPTRVNGAPGPWTKLTTR